MRQEIRDLIHQVNSQLVVANTNMHMHAANNESPRGALHFVGQVKIAFLLSVFLLGPLGKRMGRCGDRCKTVTVGNLNNIAAQSRQILPYFLYVFADLGTDLDLRTQQLGSYLRAAFFLGLGHQGFWRVNDQSTRLLVDQQIFFLNPYRKSWFVSPHPPLPFLLVFPVSIR